MVNIINGDDMNQLIKRIKKEFNNNPDLIIKDIKINILSTIYIVYLETISSSDKVNNYILKNLINKLNKINKNNITNFLAGPNLVIIDNPDLIEFYLTNGFTIIILNNQVYAIETKADISRSVSECSVETSINGPKDSFTENIQINIGLIKRRIKSNTLKTINKYIGRKTKTCASILYFDDITDTNLIKKISEKIANIDIDGITDSSTLGFFIDDEAKTVYPTIMQTERPDIATKSLLDGKIVILLDTSPYALILPAFFSDFINPQIDSYNKSQNINFIKILRFLAFFISMITPALYIALMNYNQETIPTDLLINFVIQKEGVPFPTIIETIIMLLVCEILRESDLRFPSSYGSAISILGAIVLGEASVSAGIASPITIIVIAITFISSLTFTNIELNNALRFFRFTFILFAGFLGIYGLTLAFIFFLIYTTNTNSFDKPYFAPISPFNKEYFNESVINQEVIKNTKRSTLFNIKNRIRQR